MFSQFIQGLLNTGGQTQAMQRYAQITNKVNSLNAQNNPANPLDTLYPETNKVNNAPSFEKVLQSTTTSNFGTLLLDPRLKQVNADLIKASPQLSFSNALQEANAIQANTQSATKSQILNVVNQIADKHGVDEKLVQALIKQESGFNPKAKSKAGAMGLMQLMPSTAKNLGVQDPYNIVQNVEGGVKYLRGLLDRFNNDEKLALAAYNAGPNAVKKYGGIPPYKETQNYVNSIMSAYDKIKEARL